MQNFSDFIFFLNRFGFSCTYSWLVPSSMEKKEVKYGVD